ncbi:MAG: hypothetical protein GY869_00665, partial [Planctomycetes bacterium]|nr:hypothetical protein [Planctomycetota bacterium]
FFTFAPGDTIEVLIDNELNSVDGGIVEHTWIGGKYLGEFPIGEGEYDARFRATDNLGYTVLDNVRFDVIRDIYAPVVIQPFYIPATDGQSVNVVDTVGVYTVDVTSGQVGWGVDYEASDIRFYLVEDDTNLVQIGSGYPRYVEDNLLFLTDFGSDLANGEYEIQVVLIDYINENTFTDQIRFIIDLTAPCLIDVIPPDNSF